MPKKGQTNNPNGRPTGSKNEKTKQWEALGDFITQAGASLFMENLTNLLKGPEKGEIMRGMEMYVKTLEYFKPKQVRSEVKQEDHKIIVEYVKKAKKPRIKEMKAEEINKLRREFFKLEGNQSIEGKTFKTSPYSDLDLIGFTQYYVNHQLTELKKKVEERPQEEEYRRQGDGFSYIDETSYLQALIEWADKFLSLIKEIKK